MVRTRLTQPTLLALTLVLGSLAMPSLARADVAPAEPDGCQNRDLSPKSEGAACAIKGKTGTCQYAETRRSAFPNEGGAPSRTIRCVDQNGDVLDLASGEEAVKSDAGTSTSSGSSSSTGGCALAPAAIVVGPWCIALIVPALVFGLRRRRNARSS